MEIAQALALGVRDSRADFDRIVAKTYRHAYNVAYRLTGARADAEDLLQESFIRAYRFFDRYDPNMPFENWLYRIMSRVFIDQLRRRPRFRQCSLDGYGGHTSEPEAQFDIADSSSDPELQMLDTALDERMQAALMTLPHDFRLAVILADVEDMSYEEIASATGCTVGTVRSRLHRGRKLLRARWHGLASAAGPA